jgi:O-acetyl-ADP-ribose deacetylase (regulator of RNase III)
VRPEAEQPGQDEGQDRPRGTPATPVLEVLDTDITALAVDAIANAANTQLLHGGGVAGAISRAGGPSVDAESRAAAPIGLGEAVPTGGGEMPCKWVIHAATMELGGPTDGEVIRRATASTLRCAEALGARSLALVAFGTGVGGFPVGEAARIEVEEVRRHLAAGGSGLERLVFAVRGAEAREAFERALEARGSVGL